MEAASGTVQMAHFRRPLDVNLATDEMPVSATGRAVSASFFRVLGVTPQLGRVFLPGDDAPGAPGTVVLTHAAWIDRFGGDRDIIGREIRVDGRPHAVVGVLPPGFGFTLGGGQDLFLPRVLTESERTTRGVFSDFVVGRLPPDASAVGLQTVLAPVMDGLSRTDPVNYGVAMGVRVGDLREDLVGEARGGLAVLLAAVLLVLLVGCANVASLVLARNESRVVELTVRRALGASRWALARYLMHETVVLALLGGGLGALVAVLATPALVALAPTEIPRFDEIGLHASALPVALLVSGVAGLLVGLLSALRATRGDLSGSLRADASRGSGPRGVGRLMQAVVAAETALVVLLLLSSALLLRSLEALRATPPGFEPGQRVVARLVVPEHRYPDVPTLRAFVDELVRQVEDEPGVVRAAATTNLPLLGNSITLPAPHAVGRPHETPLNAGWDAVTPGFFATAGIELRDGREFR